VNDNSCGFQNDVYGQDFISVLGKYYAYAYEDVYYTKITSSILIDSDNSSPNVINFIDNLLAQRNQERSILRDSD